MSWSSTISSRIGPPRKSRRVVGTRAVRLYWRALRRGTFLPGAGKSVRRRSNPTRIAQSRGQPHARETAHRMSVSAPPPKANPFEDIRIIDLEVRGELEFWL